VEQEVTEQDVRDALAARNEARGTHHHAARAREHAALLSALLTRRNTEARFAKLHAARTSGGWGR
jgi:hypothetical protein